MILELTDKHNFIQGFDKFGFVRLFVEVGEDGLSSRELGLGENDKIMHRYTENERGSYALFSACTFDEGDDWSDWKVASEEFEKHWNLTNSSDPCLG